VPEELETPLAGDIENAAKHIRYLQSNYG